MSQTPSVDLELISFDEPAEVRQFEKGRFEVYRVGPDDARAGDLRARLALVGARRADSRAGDCQVEHVGLVLSGQAAVRMDDGTERVMGEGEFFYVPPGHDSWVVGDEPYVSLHILGSEDYAAPSA